MERIFLHDLKVMKHGKRNFRIYHFRPTQHSFHEEGPDDAPFDIEPPPSKVKSFSEAIHSLEDVTTFLDRKGHSEEATVVFTAIDLVASFNYNSLALGRQSTLDEYFL